MFNSYKQLFSDLKAWGKAHVVCPMTRQQSRIVDTLQRQGFVSVTAGDSGLVVALLPQTIPDNMRVKVSHWKFGNRANSLSTGSYKVTHRYGAWLTYQLTDTVEHVIPFNRTKRVAA